MKQPLLTGGATLFALALAMATAPAAHAIPCNDPTLPTPVYVTGSTAIAKLLPKIAAALYNDTTATDRMNLVYSSPGGGPTSGSCSGVLGIVNGGTHPTGTLPFMGATGQFWPDATMPAMTCTIPDGTQIDVVLSDVFGSSCMGPPDLSNIEQTTLVVLPFMFIVPQASTEFYIDTRDAHLVYGKGPTAASTAPWTVAATSPFSASGPFGGVYNRNSGSGTQVTISRAIMVPAGSFLGVDTGSGGNMVTAVEGGTPAGSTLGFASADAVDPARSMLNILAYRHWGQNQFWYPDMDDTTYDKRTVRDGHYPLWSYEHADIRVTAPGVPVNANAQKLVDFMSGARVLPGTTSLIDVFSAASLPPVCAMNVSRPDDGADFAIYNDADPCGCYFEEHVTGASAGDSGCDTCTSDAMCTAPAHCHHGFCE